MTQEEIKIELVKGIEAQIWDANTGTAEAEVLLHTLHEYEYFLVRQLAKKATTLDDISSMAEAVGNAQQLLVDLVHEEQDQMCGWTYGDTPENECQALAGVLVLVSAELNTEIFKYLSNNQSK